MADKGIKKVTILYEDLPTLSSKLAGYAVRYRIVSEDKNRTSHWSPVYKVKANHTYTSGKISFSKTTTQVNVVWDKVSVIGDTFIAKTRDYDIFIKWGKSGAGDWEYYERVNTNNISLVIPDDYKVNGVLQGQKPNQLTVEVYLEGTPPSRSNTSLLMYHPTTETV